MIPHKHYLICGLVALSLVLTPVVSAQTVDVTSASIEDLNRAFDAGTLTSERLVELYLARIDAYDAAGPRLNAVIVLNPRAMERARALDVERRTSGPRSPVHGVPVVLKDNIDTADLPTTAGSSLLAGSMPPDDAFLVQKLREAGAIILAKVNMSEFASGGAVSSLGGPTRNPHDLVRSPAGSSGGTGASIAAAYAQFGFGTDTGGSIRGPSTANGIVGLKPTHGLIGRDGIIGPKDRREHGGTAGQRRGDTAESEERRRRRDRGTSGESPDRWGARRGCHGRGWQRSGRFRCRCGFVKCRQQLAEVFKAFGDLASRRGVHDAFC